MPGFEELDESWQAGGTSVEEAQPIKPSASAPPTTAPLAESTTRSNRIPPTATEGTFFDARATLAGSSNQQAAVAPPQDLSKPKRTWNETKGGMRSSHLRPHARPMLPSLTDSETVLQPGPSSAVLRKRSQDVRKASMRRTRSSSDGDDIDDDNAEAGPSSAPETLENHQRDAGSRSRSSSQSSSSSRSELKTGGGAEMRSSPRQTRPQALSDEDGDDDTPSFAGVTASEGGAGATFIHHSDASSLPPILRPAWQAGPSGAADPRTPGGAKRGKGALVGGDMFTPLKLQTMFKTPTPPDAPPVKGVEASSTPAGAELDTPSRQPAPSTLSAEAAAAARPSTPPPANSNPTRSNSNAAFTFRSPYMPGSGVTDSPFAHLATPRTQQKKRGLSAEAYAHIGRTPSASTAATGTAPGTGAKTLPIRLFVFESAKKAEKQQQQGLTQSPGRMEDGEQAAGDGRHMAALQDAVRLYDEKLKEAEQRLAATRTKRRQSGAPDLAADEDIERGDAEPEMKRLRLHLPDRRRSATPRGDNETVAVDVDVEVSAATRTSPMRVSVRRQPAPVSPIWERRPTSKAAAIQYDESPRKLLRKFSAAGQVEREIEAERGAPTSASSNLDQGVSSDDEKRRDEELAAIEERIRRRKEGRLAGMATPAAARMKAPAEPSPAPPRMVLVDENGQSETLPAPGFSRTYSASNVALQAARAAATPSAQSMAVAVPTTVTKVLVDTIPEVSRETLSSTPPTASGIDASPVTHGLPVSALPSTLQHQPRQPRTVSLEAANGSVEPSPPPATSVPSDPFHAPNTSAASNSVSGSSLARFPSRREATPKASSPVPIPTPAPAPARRGAPAATPSSTTTASRGTTPILKPTYALHRGGTASPAGHVFSQPKSSSALRNEVVISDAEDSTRSSSSMTLRGDESSRIEARTAAVGAITEASPFRDAAAAGRQSRLAAHAPASATSTPARRSAPPSIPRSILKSAAGGGADASSSATPSRVSRGALEPPRSISFADGKTSGKMFAQSPLAGIARRRAGVEEEEDSWERDDGDDEEEASIAHEAAPRTDATLQNGRQTGKAPASVRAARIQELLEQVKALALEEERAGRDDEGGFAAAPPSHVNGADDSWQAPSPTSRFSTRLTPFDSPASAAATPQASRRSIASTSRRGGGARSVWSFGDSVADKTFLTTASFEVAHDRIVEVLTDVAPWVDDWEELTELDLSDRKLETVVRLKEFTPKLESLRLDGNALSYLTGLPGTLRALHLRGNRVPSIVSFGHLRSLSTLDVSGNDLDDLGALECLVHLRHLRADDNAITDVSGIARLEHVHSLSLRHNRLAGKLDVTQTAWRHLAHLDVAHNALTEVKGVWHCGKYLKTIDVGSNDLTRLDLGTGVMHKLRTLRVSSNARLERLDVLPAARSLRQLYADFCALERIDHLGACDRLEAFSARQQLTDPSKAAGGFRWPGAQVKDVKSLFLSGNAFGEEFGREAANVYVPRALGSLPAGLPNTQLSASSFSKVAYLELSACQLTALPPNLGILFPNLHQLVLDHNLFSRLPASRRDTSGGGGGGGGGSLSSLPRLKRVSLIGCRIKSTRNLIEAFEGCEQLVVLDARMNPATLGLYPPVFAAAPFAQQEGAAAGLVGASPAFLAPMPNAETLRPDTVLEERRREERRRVQEERGAWEKSFFHKVHPRPQGEDGDADSEDGTVEDADETVRPSTGKAGQQPAPASKPGASSSSSSWYALCDERFSRTLPRNLAMRRTLHRGTLGMVCPSLAWLDGLPLKDEEVHEAERILLAEEGDADGQGKLSA